jgi:hypothetical protein
MRDWRKWRIELAVPMMIFPVWLATMLSPAQAVAAPAKVFSAYLDRIQQNLPPQFAMRLPAEVLLGGPADEEFLERLIVRVMPSTTPLGLTVGLHSCQEDSPFCLIGTFSVISGNSPIAQQEYRQHRAAASPIQLTKYLRGYVLERTAALFPSRMSSVMWQQGNLFYTIKFSAPERQNMLYMAVSMANAEPIYALNPVLRGLSEQRYQPANLSDRALRLFPLTGAIVLDAKRP